MKHPTKSVEKRVAVVGCKHTTRDFIVRLDRCGYRIDHCVTISPAQGDRQKVAGYHDLRAFLDQHGIRWTSVERYSLKSDSDQEALLSLGFDVLLVIGWQRLIPDWWLESLSVGAFGMHGSSKPLPHGRGRSPLNWSLIQNKTVFFTHLFQYRPGVDDGPIVGVQVFDITPFDTSLTLHHKNLIAMVRLCEAHLPALMDGTAELVPQPSEDATHYPKRTAEDGLIYWSDGTTDLYNLIRAVTRPFPGAITYLDDEASKRVMIWRAIPFDTRLPYPSARPGEVVEVFYDGSFVVRTGDATLLVLEHDGHGFTERDIGRCLGHLGTPRRRWDGIPQ